METEELYLQLGSVLTNIIDTVNTIAKSQKARLKHYLQNQLRVTEELYDPKGRLRLYNMRLTFPKPDQVNITNALEACIEFIDKNQERFNTKMKTISLQIVQELSAIYLGTSKEEKIVLNKLTSKLKRIKIKEYVRSF